jgi:hypothetical protein
LLAIIGLAPLLVYLLLCFFFFAAMALFGAFFPVFGGHLSSLAMIVFLVPLYGEASGRTSAGGRRKAAMVAAVIRVLGAVSYFVAFRALSAGMHAFSLIGCAAWTAFYVVFAREADPLSKRVTSNLAAFLAAFTVVSAGLNFYSYRQLLWAVPPLPSVDLVNALLPFVMTTLERVGLLVFLVVVWRYRPAPSGPEDRAQETI